MTELLKPIREPHATGTLRGTSYEDENVMDLPYTAVAFTDGQLGILSVWKASFWQRLRFLFDGRVNLVVLGNSQPAVCIGLGDFFVDTEKETTEAENFGYS